MITFLIKNKIHSTIKRILGEIKTLGILIFLTYFLSNYCHVNYMMNKLNDIVSNLNFTSCQKNV